MSGEERRDALPAGYQLHEYLFERVLGAGGFGITYLAKDVSLGTRRVAIKEYLPKEIAIREGQSVHARSAREQGEYENGLRRFIREARTLGEFHHENIVRVVRLIEGVNNTAYMVMEYEEGESLERLLERRSTPPDEEMLRHILYPLIAGLEEVHRKGFLHRDIKPGNIYIRRKDASPVLLDFGLARQAVGGSRSAYAALTPGYAPIEQYESQSEQGPWTDIYALGAVMYRAISGSLSPESVARSNTVHVNKGKDPMTPAVQAGKGRYSLVFLRAIDHALSIRAKDRPQSVDAWREELEGSFSWYEVRRHLPMAGGMLAAGVAAVVGLALWRSPGAEFPGAVSAPEVVHRAPVLRVNSTPVGMTVYVDGKRVGVTPVAPVADVAEGEHEVRVIGDPNQYEEYRERVRVSRERPVEVMARMREVAQTGDILVRSDPAGAEILLDGQRVGVTPKQVAGVGKGNRVVELRLEGYEEVREQVSVAPGGLVEVERRLTAAKPRAGSHVRKTIDGVEFDWVWVPEGSYRMGCGSWSSDCSEDEKPVHTETVGGLWMGKYEVTQGQWRGVMGGDPPDLDFKDCGLNCPVEGVSWDDVQEFIVRLNRAGDGCRYRLPTEAEWEYACRSGGKEEKYCGGNNLDALAWYDGNSGSKTHPVGRKTSNGLGLYDMSGNVWEWTCSNWGSYSDNGKNHAKCSSGGSIRVERGGSWLNDPAFVRSALRNYIDPGLRSGRLGFRLSRTCP